MSSDFFLSARINAVEQPILIVEEHPFDGFGYGARKMTIYYDALQELSISHYTRPGWSDSEHSLAKCPKNWAMI